MTLEPDQRARAVELRAQGVAVGEIAVRLGVSMRTAVAWLRRPARFAPRECWFCGERFVPTNGRQRYCTVEHWEQHRRGGTLVRECRLCGEPFRPTNGRQVFCTPEHRAEYHRQHGEPSTTAGWRDRVQQLEAEVTRARAQLDEREAA